MNLKKNISILFIFYKYGSSQSSDYKQIGGLSFSCRVMSAPFDGFQNITFNKSNLFQLRKIKISRQTRKITRNSTASQNLLSQTPFVAFKQ
jgi:hypothetical protein